MYTDGGNATLRTNPGSVGMPLQNFLHSLRVPQMQVQLMFGKVFIFLVLLSVVGLVPFCQF